MTATEKYLPAAESIDADLNAADNTIRLCGPDDKKKSQSEILIEIGSTAELFHDDSNDAFAEINKNAIKATLAVRSKDFREYLSHEFYTLTEKGASASAMVDAINTLEAQAKFGGVKKTVCIRTYHTGADVFIDQGCDQRAILHIDKTDWRYADHAPVQFVRKRGMKQLPNPTRHGDLSRLSKYINVSDEDFPLVYGWLLCALAGVKPYPVLVLQGEQGTGKSTTSRVLRSLVDPSSVPLRSPPREIKDLLVSAVNNHVVVLDNLSGLNSELSDCLCRLSTGGGIDYRALYTDNEQNLIEIQRPVMVNGIDDIASRQDLSNRALIVSLPVISSSARRTESDFWKQFERDQPSIFTGLLSCIASGLQNINDVPLPELPRMADVARWVTACEFNIDAVGDFIHAHNRNQDEAVLMTLEASPVGSAILTLLKDKCRFVGTPTELLSQLTKVVGDNQARSKSWPQSPKGLRNIITRLLPIFRSLGVKIEQRRTVKGREYVIEKIES